MAQLPSNHTSMSNPDPKHRYLCGDDTSEERERGGGGGDLVRSSKWFGIGCLTVVIIPAFLIGLGLGLGLILQN